MSQFVHAGKRYGRLRVVARVDSLTPGRYGVKVVCDCGTIKVISSKTVYRTKSCGCLKREKIGDNAKKHGYHGTRTYRSWQAMKGRCYRRGATGYENYGGRGIIVCKRWRDSFEAFLEDMGERPPGKTLDREDNEGNYRPGNCRWATPTTQQNNRRVK